MALVHDVLYAQKKRAVKQDPEGGNIRLTVVSLEFAVPCLPGIYLRPNK